MFDIKDFYPSIKEDLLIKALEFAKQHVKHSLKSLLIFSDWGPLGGCLGQFLKIQAAPNLKKSKRLFKECLRTKVWILS